MSEGSSQDGCLQFLHLEDSLIDAELTGHVLRGEWPGCQIRRVQDREEFTNALNRAKFDIILSDFTLPDFNGLEALEIAQRVQPRTPYIFMSGTIGEDNAVTALHHGATDYIIKDRPVRLIPAIRRALVEARQRQIGGSGEGASEEKFLQLAEHSADVFWFAEPNPERLVYVSGAYERIWGQPVEALYSDAQQWDRAVHPDDRARVRASFNECLSGTRPFFEEQYRVVRPDGTERWVIDRGTAIRGADGRLERICGIARDITDRVEMEKQMLRSQRLESVGMLAGGIAHDLNNVFSPILMSLNLVRLKSSDAEVLRLLDVLDTSVQHGAGLIRQILAFARGVEGERVNLDPAPVIRDLAKLLEETMPKSVRIKTEIQAPLAHVLSTSTQLSQVLMNLCINARDAMPDGGLMLIRASNANVDTGLARAHPWARLGPHLVIGIRDTGVGMPRSVIDRIFDPFFTTKPPGKGTGLGLSTVLGIVKSHSGFVTVESEPGRGSEFQVYLPAVPVARAPSRPPSPWSGRRGKGELILVIDDEEVIRVMAKSLLEAGGYRTIIAEDGPAGVAAFRARHSEIHVVLTDLMMPFMDGAEVIRQLRAIDPSVRVVAMTGMAEDPQDVVEEPGKLTFLHKPMTGAEFFQAIQRVSAVT